LIKSGDFEETATEDLLHFLEGFGMVKKIIREKSPLVGKTLADLKLNQKGILVLGIEREKEWIATPDSRETIRKNDRLVIYGPLEILKKKLMELKASVKNETEKKERKAEGGKDGNWD
jgi:uncharacterized protein with PhoU and TrkA domain